MKKLLGIFDRSLIFVKPTFIFVGVFSFVILNIMFIKYLVPFINLKLGNIVQFNKGLKVKKKIKNVNQLPQNANDLSKNNLSIFKDVPIKEEVKHYNKKKQENNISAFNIKSNSFKHKNNIEDNDVIELTTQDSNIYSSKYITIKKVIFKKKLLVGKTYKIKFLDNFNEWVIKWALINGNVLRQNEDNLVPFEVLIKNIANVSNNQSQNNNFVKLRIHADFVNKAKGLNNSKLASIEQASAKISNVTNSNYLKANVKTSINLISQIIYSQNKEIYIRPRQNFYLQEIELWTIKPQTGKSNSFVFNFNRDKASVNSQNIAKVSNYNTAYNLDVSSGLKFSTLNIIPRSVWGINPGQWDPIKKNLNINDVKRLKYIKLDNCRWLPEYYRPTRIVIHHTVTHNYPNDPYREIREIYIYHAYSRGWGDIGYNYLIDSSGRIFEGKIGGDGVKGYHAFESANDMSIGIALIGDFSYSNPTSAQLNSLKKLLAEKSALYGINLHYTGSGSLNDWLNQGVTVFGHRNVWVWNWSNNSWKYHATACPGQKFVVSGKLQQVVQEANNYAQNHYQSIKNARQWAINSLSSYIDNSNIFAQAEFTDNSANRQALLSKIPKFSGIKNIYLGPDKKLHMTIGIIDNNACGWVVPPKGWNGYDSCGNNGCMYFPTYKGPYDRAIILFTLFKLNPLFKSIKITNGNTGWVE